MNTPPETAGTRHFVGRADVVAELQARAATQRELCVEDASGVHGIGKTTLLRRLYDVLEEDDYQRVYISMRRFDPEPGGTADERDPARAARTNLDNFERLLIEIGEQLGLDDFVKHATETKARQAETMMPPVSIVQKVSFGVFNRIGRDVRIGDMNIRVPANEAAVLTAIDDARRKLTRELTDLVNGLGSRVVFLVDDFQALLQEQVERWFLDEFLADLENAAAVLFRVASPVPLSGALDRVHEMPLRNFDAEETATYLRGRLREAPDAVCREVFKLTRGHPQAVALAANALESHGEADSLAFLYDVPDDAPLARLVDEIHAEVSDEDVRAALEVAWVARRFDAQLLRRLLAAEDESEDEVARRVAAVLPKLAKYAFTEKYDGARPYYRVHDFIRREKARKLRELDSARYQTLNAEIAAYYRGLMEGVVEGWGDSSAYRRAYRFETPEWKEPVKEWIFHTLRAGDPDAARVSFANLFFDAFWWYDWYTSSGFCGELLDEFEHSRHDDETRDLVAELREFLAAYPAFRDDAWQGDWRRVQRKVRSVRKRLAVGASDPEKIDGEERRHLRALTDLFLAHARRNLGLTDPRVDALYAEARTLLEGVEDDEWILAWVEFELGDLAFARDDPAAALTRAEEAIRLARKADEEDRDYEVLANAHRLRADVQKASDDAEGAVESSLRSVYCAYAFQTSSVPDFYTRAFYTEMTAHAARVLGRIVDELPPRESEKLLVRVLAFWRPYREATAAPDADLSALASGGAGALADGLFPRPPRDEELDTDTSEYVEIVREVQDEIGADEALRV